MNGRMLAGQASVAGSHHVDQAPALAAAEFHLALGKGEQRVVSATPDVLTWVEPGAPLADDDRTGRTRSSRRRP